jgi:glycerol uptake facilitator-like aquaporin
MLLAATVIGSGIMAERLAGRNLAVALIANTGATVAVLATLIAHLGPVGGAHFNPAVSFIEALRGNLSFRAAIAYAIVQILGCLPGACLAHAIFELPIIQTSMHMRTGSGTSAPRKTTAFICRAILLADNVAEGSISVHSTQKLLAVGRDIRGKGSKP